MNRSLLNLDLFQEIHGLTIQLINTADQLKSPEPVRAYKPTQEGSHIHSSQFFGGFQENKQQREVEILQHSALLS